MSSLSLSPSRSVALSLCRCALATCRPLSVELSRLGLPSATSPVCRRTARASLLLLPSDSSSSVSADHPTVATRSAASATRNHTSATRSHTAATNGGPARAGRPASCRLSRLLSDLSAPSGRTPSLSSVFSGASGSSGFTSGSSGFASGGSSKATSEASDCELSLDGDCDSESGHSPTLRDGIESVRRSSGESERDEAEDDVARLAPSLKRGSDSSDDTVVERRPQPRATSPSRLNARVTPESPRKSPARTPDSEPLGVSDKRSLSRSVAASSLKPVSKKEELSANSAERPLTRSSRSPCLRSPPKSDSKSTAKYRLSRSPIQSSEESSEWPVSKANGVVSTTSGKSSQHFVPTAKARLEKTASFEFDSESDCDQSISKNVTESKESLTIMDPSPRAKRSAKRASNSPHTDSSGYAPAVPSASERNPGGKDAPVESPDVTESIWPALAQEAGSNDGEHLFGANRERLFDAWLANLERRNRRLADEQLTVRPPMPENSPNGGTSSESDGARALTKDYGDGNCMGAGLDDRQLATGARAEVTVRRSSTKDVSCDAGKGLPDENPSVLLTKRNDFGTAHSANTDSGSSGLQSKNNISTSPSKTSEGDENSMRSNGVFTKQVELENGTKVEVKMRKKKVKKEKDGSGHKSVAAKVAKYQSRQSLPIVSEQSKPKVVAATLKNGTTQSVSKCSINSIPKNSECNVVEGRITVALRKTPKEPTSDSTPSLKRNTIHLPSLSKPRPDPADPADTKPKPEPPRRGHVTFRSALRFFQDQSTADPESEAVAEAGSERVPRPLSCAPALGSSAAGSEESRAASTGSAIEGVPVPPPRRRAAGRAQRAPASPSSPSPPASHPPSPSSPPPPPPPPPPPAPVRTSAPVPVSPAAQRRAQKAGERGAATSPRMTAHRPSTGSPAPPAHGMDSVLAELKGAQRSRLVPIEGGRVPRLSCKDTVLSELQGVQEGRLERPSRPAAAPSRLFRRLQCEFSDSSTPDESTAVVEGRPHAEGESTDADGRSLADSGISSKNSLSTESGFSEDEPT